MALTATFRADFGDFYDAVQKATVELKKLGDTTKPVEVALNRMVDQFSGRKMIQETTLLVEAVNKLEGGLSNLTRKELTALAAKVDETTEKMQKMGVAVPESFRKVQEAAAQAKPATESWSQSLGKLQTVVQGLIALQAVQWVISFGREVLDTAQTLTKLSAQTGVSVEWLQKFQVAGADAGNTVDQIANGVSQLQKRLAGGGTDSAVGALKDLNLSLDDLRGLAPEEQFIEIAREIAAIKDPLEQTKAATVFFGPLGVQLLPTIKRGFDDVKDAAAGMSKETVASLAELGNEFGKLMRTTKDWVGTSIAYFYEYSKFAAKTFTGQQFSQNAEAQRKATELLKDLADELERMGKAIDKTKGLPAGLPVIVPTAADLTAMRTHVVLTDKQIAAQKQVAEANRDAKQSIVELEGVAAVYRGQITQNIKVFETAADKQAALIAQSEWAAKQNADIGKKIRAQSQQLLAGDVADAREYFAQYLAWEEKLAAASASVWQGPINQVSAFSGLMGQLPGQILGAIQGGGNVTQTIGASVGGTVATGLSKTIGAALGGVLGSVLPGLGTMLGGLGGGALGNLFGKLFGSEGKEVNKIRDAFVLAAGGINELNKQAQAAGVSLDNLLGAKKKGEYESAANALTTAFQFQQDAMATLLETTQRYGFTLEELGPAMARQELDKQAQQLFKDWEVLNAAGIDTIAITTRMSESMNAYLRHAMTMGTEVPLAMKPMIQQMIQMGTLTDASGNKIESLETSGISFALSMSEGFKTLIDQVTKLTDAIARGLGLAIKNVPALNVPVNYQGGPVPTLASDGGASLTGTVTTGGNSSTVVVNAQGAFFDTPGDVQRLADKVDDALTQKYGLRYQNRAA